MDEEEGYINGYKEERKYRGKEEKKRKRGIKMAMLQSGQNLLKYHGETDRIRIFSVWIIQAELSVIQGSRQKMWALQPCIFGIAVLLLVSVSILLDFFSLSFSPASGHS